jgi:hypothetical protein
MFADRFGYWEVCGKKYTNKLQAAIAAVSQGHWIHWNFNEDTFGRYDWTQEPIQSLQELYDSRARSIREKYSFVALEFSGGTDSWNILNSFCRQKLKVDLVIHKVIESQVGDISNHSAQNIWAEGKFQAWRSFLKFQELVPDMKWATWDIEKCIVDGWRQGPRDILSINGLDCVAQSKMSSNIDLNPFNIPNLPSTAYLFGIDKPIVELHNDGWYIVFYDQQPMARCSAERTLAGIGWHDLFFYWDPDCVPLIIKQAHVILNFFRQHPNHPDLVKILGSRRQQHKNLITRLIYPDYQEIWQSEKVKGHIAFDRDDWFINQLDDLSNRNWHKTAKNYSDTVKELTQDTPFAKYVHLDANDSRFTVLADCPGRRYYLGPP